MDTLPPEILEVIYSQCDLVSIVKSRLVCTHWNRAVQLHLARLKIIYIGKEFILKTSVPWLEPEEVKSFEQQKSNTILPDEQAEHFKSSIDMVKLIVFVSRYCVNIEAFVCDQRLPFELFAALLGPKLRFFSGQVVYDWTIKSKRRFPLALIRASKKLFRGRRVHSEEILAKFPKLESFPWFHGGKGGGPCLLTQLKYKLPLKMLMHSCNNFHLDHPSGCINELLRISLQLKYGQSSNCSPTYQTLDPSFAFNIKVLRIEAEYFSGGQIFYFPSLKKIIVCGYVYLSNAQSIRLSLVDSPKLQSLQLTSSKIEEIMPEMIQLLPGIPDLRELIFEPARTFSQPSKPSLEFYQALVINCFRLEELVLPSIELDPPEVLILQQLPNLKVFEYEVTPSPEIIDKVCRYFDDILCILDQSVQKRTLAQLNFA